MKRANNLFPKLVSEENLRLAIFAVNVTHRFHPHHRPNRTVARVEADVDRYVKELREIITGGYEANEPRLARRWDKSAGKWRDISEPRLWPDQYVHHAVIQVLEPIMMRGMDNFCCGSIRNRGIHYGVRAIKKWMRTDPKGTKYAEELDIHHFYDSLTAETVMKRLRRLVKDRRMLEVCERLMKHGILIGAYFSQWFANTVLQPLDRLIRESGLCDHYLRYMDNFTLFGRNKRKLRRLRELIEKWLAAHGLRLNGKWQLYPTAKRTVAALGYRFGRGYTLLRKRNMVRLKHSLSACRRAMRRHHAIKPALAQGLLSRLGQMKHCNHVHFFPELCGGGFAAEIEMRGQRTRKKGAGKMEYVYGTSVIGGVERENLKIVGGPALREGEYLTTVREYDDSSITDRCRIDRHYHSDTDEDGTRYDFYTISEHYRYVERIKVMEETRKATEIAFVTLAENGSIDAVTAGEHKSLFETWQTGVAYTVGQLRNWGDKLYKCVQAHTSQAGWEPDKAVSLWSAASDPAEEWPEWSQPVGAHDAYAKGDKVSHNGKHWTSTADANVWEPGVYGWTEATA